MTRHRTLIRLSAALAGVALVWACGGDSPTAPPTPEPARPATVTVSPTTAELTALGATVQLTAEVRDQNARVMAGVTVTWSSGDTSVATVDASGLVTGVAEGTATITASAGSASGSAVVTVTQSVASVEVSPSVADLAALGATVQLTAEAFDANGHAVAEAEFSWESSDNSVASVDASGLVTGVAEGTATITASAGSASGSAVVTVTQSVASVEVSPATAELTALDATIQLTTAALDANGRGVAGAEFSWESSDAAVATVDAAGLVTGVAEGVATITATAGGVSGRAIVTVLDFTALITPYPIHTHYLGDVSEENKRTIDAAALEWGRILNPTPAASFTFDETVDCWGSDWGSRSWSRGEDTTKYLKFNAGDTLAPGLHLYFKHPPGPRYAGRNGVYANMCAKGDPYTPGNRPPIVTIKSVAERGTSDVPMSPIGIIGLGPEGHTISRATALHEIGHTLGIGESLSIIDGVDDRVIENRGRWGRWIKQLDPSEPRNIYLTDPKVIAVFDRMGGTGFPETTPKIPLITPHHWDGCSGHGDVMSYGLTREEYEAATITELSAAALQEGYVYDPGQIDTSVRMNSLRWNSESSSWTCRDGQRAWPGAAQSPTTDGTLTDVHSGIIYEFDPR